MVSYKITSHHEKAIFCYSFSQFYVNIRTVFRDGAESWRNEQMEPMYLSIRPVETGKRIKQLLSEQNYTIREIQGAFGFENPQAIYKWISGKSLPSLDNFIILSRLLHTSIEDILVIDGDISFSRIFLNYRFNDIPARLSYNHTIRKRYGKSVRREKIMKNFLKLGGLSILSCQYMYVDHEDYLADALFAQNQVPVRFGHEFKRNGSPYCIITCRVWKKDVAGFGRTMESLYNKMLLLGHSDYAEFCEELMGMIEKERGAA